MNRPDDAHEPSADRVIRALVEAIRKDDWTRIDAAWERTRIPWGIHIRRDAALDADAFLLDALRDAQSRGILHAFIRELIYEDLLADSDLRQISLLPGGPAWQVQAFQNGVFGVLTALTKLRSSTSEHAKTAVVTVGSHDRERHRLDPGPRVTGGPGRREARPDG